MSTSSLLDDNVFMLVQDQYLRDMCLWKPRRQTVTYFNSSLSNLNALSLRIVDAQGQALTFYDQVGTPIIGKPLGSRVTMDYNAYIAANTDTNASVRYTNTVMQVMYDISIGVSENELATRVQYR